LRHDVTQAAASIQEHLWKSRSASSTNANRVLRSLIVIYDNMTEGKDFCFELGATLVDVTRLIIYFSVAKIILTGTLL
jgi:hypothetical protein